MRSTLPPAVLAVLVLLGMLATAVWAQGVPAPVSNPNVTVTGSVTAASDGGFGVVVRGPLEPLPDGGVALGIFVPEVVRVVGPTFGEVLVSGTVNLSGATLGALGTATCTQAESHRLSLTTTPTIIPSEPPISGRTRWTVFNIDGTKRVSCRVDPGDGGVPDCNTPGFGLTALPNGGVVSFPVRESDTVRCVACTNGATIEHTEEACVTPN